MKNIKQTIKAVKLSLVLLETLEELSPDNSMGGIPEGHAYMAFMGLVDLDQFQSLLSGLKRVNAIESKHNFITRGNDFDKVVKSFKGLIQTWESKLAEAHA